ncbi:kinase-like protein, partial [Wolfiporia cocos MD-104 SS10]
FFREVVKWKHISHPNIVPYVAVALGEHQVYITNEWMNRGNVKQYLTQNPDANRRNLIYDAGLGLSYLHTNDIIHGNLRATNVLINDAGRACIADFGIATALYKDSVAPAFTSTFISFENVRWMAPEVLFPDSVETSSPLAEGDVYSFAMVMWEIFTGQVPFNRVHPTAVICKVVQGARPSRPANVASLGLSDAVWDLMCLCWQEDRFRRPKMPGLLVYL